MKYSLDNGATWREANSITVEYPAPTGSQVFVSLYENVFRVDRLFDRQKAGQEPCVFLVAGTSVWTLAGEPK